MYDNNIVKVTSITKFISALISGLFLFACTSNRKSEPVVDLSNCDSDSFEEPPVGVGNYINRKLVVTSVDLGKRKNDDSLSHYIQRYSDSYVCFFDDYTYEFVIPCEDYTNAVLGNYILRDNDTSASMPRLYSYNGKNGQYSELKIYGYRSDGTIIDTIAPMNITYSKGKYVMNFYVYEGYSGMYDEIEITTNLILSSDPVSHFKN